jgi:hypothetical protein
MVLLFPSPLPPVDFAYPSSILPQDSDKETPNVGIFPNI